jgi:hypothetical protein
VVGLFDDIEWLALPHVTKNENKEESKEGEWIGGEERGVKTKEGANEEMMEKERKKQSLEWQKKIRGKKTKTEKNSRWWKLRNERSDRRERVE